MFPKEALTEDHFQGAGRITSEAPGSLHEILNATRNISNGGSYYVHPTAEGAFETIYDAITQADLDHPDDGSLITIEVAAGFSHALPVAGLEIDKAKHYYFMCRTSDVSISSGSGYTKITGNLDLKATALIGGSIRPRTVFNNVKLESMALTVRSGRRLIFENVVSTSTYTLNVEHGTESVDILLNRYNPSGYMVLNALDIPTTPASYLKVEGSQLGFLTHASYNRKVGGFSQIELMRCDVGVYNIGTEGLFDLQSKAVTVKFTSCSFEALAGALLYVVKNAASGTIYWGGTNRFSYGGVIGAGDEYAVDFTGPTHIRAPSLDTGKTPVAPPAGTTKLDNTDDGGTWAWLVWNGSAWV